MWFWFFAVSATLNVFVLFYVRWLLSGLATINTEIENVSDMIKDFGSHIKSLHEMEMFYGDQTLKSLMDHSDLLIDTLENMDLMLNDEQEQEEEQVEKEA